MHACMNEWISAKTTEMTVQRTILYRQGEVEAGKRGMFTV